ncbi:MAG: hypothetical protein ABJK37_03535 [Paraglaciecola sp.]|uniref:hypothetical protein n=1 Tax=Paraglaciecola sp. TaxID=1920173 RepID=UPI003297F2DA
MPIPSTTFLWVLLLSLCVMACGGSNDAATAGNSTSPNSQTDNDTIPNAFNFSSVQNVSLNTQLHSETITISGINAATTVSINNGQFKINEGEFSSTATTVSNNDKITISLTSANEYNTTHTATLTIGNGNVSATFDVTTLTAPSLNNLIDVNLHIKHSVGGIDRFDREKFITIHANHTENDWYTVGENKLDDLITDFTEGFDVYFGRDAGGIGWNLSNLPQDPNNFGFVDPQATTERGFDVRWNYTNQTDQRSITQRNLQYRNHNLIVSGQQHPYWPDGTLTGQYSAQSWAFSQNDSQNEPFGSATGDYIGRYVSEFFNNGSDNAIGAPPPAFVEVMNEPLYDLYDVADNPVELAQVFEFHKSVANQIRNTNIKSTTPNSTLKIGGYTAAFPDFDADNFQEWEERDKLFIDIAGADMDFISLHLYDMPRFSNTVQFRKGSNIEATFDMLEHYTNIKFGTPKPFIVSEYGAQVHSMLQSPWSPQRDWLIVNSVNAQLMHFLERPHLMEMSIPFITVKAEWGRISENVPYTHRLMRQQKEAEGETGDLWVYTDLVKFYQLWSDVNGVRAESKSNDLDLQVDAYVEGQKAYIIVNSLEMQATSFSLSVHGIDLATIEDITLKHLYSIDGKSVLEQQTLASIPDNIKIGAEATMIFEVSMQNNIAMPHTAFEQKYYATSYKQSIIANISNTFSIENIVTADEGEAVLRLGVGRTHGLSLLPKITFNDVTISVPEDYRGYDQYHNGKGRANYFGVIEIPVPLNVLRANNSVNITFSDTGGFISSLSLQVLNSDTQLIRGY